MGIELSSWRQRIGVFVRSPRPRPTRARLNLNTNFFAPRSLHKSSSRKCEILLCLVPLGCLYVSITLVQQTTVSLPQPAESDSFNRPPGTQRSFSFRNRPHYQLSTLQYLHTPSPTLNSVYSSTKPNASNLNSPDTNTINLITSITTITRSFPKA